MFRLHSGIMSGLCVVSGRSARKIAGKKRYFSKLSKDVDQVEEKTVPRFADKTMFFFISPRTDKDNRAGWFSWVDSSRTPRTNRAWNVASLDELHRNKVERCRCQVPLSWNELFLSGIYRFYSYIWKFLTFYCSSQDNFRFFRAP